MTRIVDFLSTMWRFCNVLRGYCNAFKSSIRWSLVHVGRTINDAADVLTRIASLGMNFIEFV